MNYFFTSKWISSGIHINIPVYHEVQRVDMRESSLAIADLSGYTSDNVPVTCSGSLFFRITDGYKACFGVSDVEENIRRTGTSAMRSVLGSFSYDSVSALAWGWGDCWNLAYRLLVIAIQSTRNWTQLLVILLWIGESFVLALRFKVSSLRKKASILFHSITG